MRAQLGLSDDRSCERLYDQRYAGGYMDDWPASKLQRIRTLLRELDLPGPGPLIDFGCGTGVFTEIMRDCLPGRQIIGLDVSRTALQKARSNISGCDFQHVDEHNVRAGSAAFLFTHHVLEHVRDLSATWESMTSLLAERALMLHVLPCGDAGSFEHKLCLLRTDGIDGQQGGRFFFEDPAHLRRLTTGQMIELAARYGFRLLRADYSHHRFEAINWLTGNGVRFVLNLCDPAGAVDAQSARELARHRRRLLAMAAVKSVARRQSLLTWPVTSLSRLLSKRWAARAEREWQAMHAQPGGSEMYLLFEPDR